MKRLLFLSSVALLGLLLTGCQTSSALNQMHVGMSKADVIALLGSPDSTSAQSNIEYLTYYLEVATQNGPVRDQAYFVRLVDGKVESYGRFSAMEDLYMRPVSNSQTGATNAPPPWALGGPPQGASQAPAAQATDLATELTRLKALKDQGVLTDEEFQKAKEKLLAEQQ